MNTASGPRKSTLAFALAIQLVAIGALFAARSGARDEPPPFLDFDASRIDALAVASADGSINLSKTADDWLMTGDLRADKTKVDALLDKLSNAAGGWPVASSDATAERFEVTAGNHQRRVTLKAGDDTVADIYLGTSPGYRKTHARHVDGGEDIYAISFSNYEAGVKTADWLDRAVLRPDGEITAIRRIGGAPAFALRKDAGGTWSADDGDELDPVQAETLAGRFTGLSATDVHQRSLPDAPDMVFEVDDEAGTQTLRIYRMASQGGGPEDDYVATSDRASGRYRIASYTAEQMDISRADLAPDPLDAADSLDAQMPEDAALLSEEDAQDIP